ncbi:MAG: hypothetical protein HOO86_00590 [Bacteroidales bacterium]|nr:hypothetical protein [Bacteroidales bacterium]
MKSKTWPQWIILIVLIAFEFFIFSNHFKYDLLQSIYPDFNEFFIENLLYFKMSLVVLLIISITIYSWLLKKKKIELFFIVFLIKALQKRPGNWIGLANMSYVLISISLFTKESTNNTCSSILNGLVLFGFMLLYTLFIVNYFLPGKSENNEQPKVLITAVSYNNTIDPILKSLKEMENDDLKDKWSQQVFYNEDGTIKMNGTFIFGPWGNLDPIRKSIIAHEASFETIVLIISCEVSVKINKWPEELKPKRLIEDFLSKCYPDKTIEIRLFADGNSGNNMENNGVGIDSILSSLKIQKYNDKDIMFNITGGTAAMSTAMILKAISRERRAEYTNQDSGLIEEVPITINSVKDLWAELLERAG